MNADIPLSCTQSITRPPISKTIPPFSLEKAKVIAKKGSEALVLAHEAGVNVAFGTDTGPNLQLAEFDLRKAVLPSPVVLKQATFNSGEYDLVHAASDRVRI
jgi:hypothetical protein